jgi:recombination protein RecR
MPLPRSLAELVGHLGLLPGVGPKTAERYAFAIVKRPRAERERLARAIVDADVNLAECARCHNVAEGDPCPVCRDATRDQRLLCVVATERDLLAIEQTGGYHGLYHVLGGVLAPADGVEPHHLTVAHLVSRVADEQPAEVIMALDPTIEGETTMLHLSRLLRDSGSHITRLAKGLPSGSEVTYADELTLGAALAGRREIAVARAADAVPVPIRPHPETVAVQAPPTTIPTDILDAPPTEDAREMAMEKPF